MSTAFEAAVYITLFVISAVGATLLLFLTFSWIEHLVKGVYSTARAWNYALAVFVLFMSISVSFMVGVSQGRRAQLTKDQILDIARTNFIETLDNKNKGQ